MKPFWVVLRESMYLIRFGSIMEMRGKCVSMGFRVYNGREISGYNGGPPYEWSIMCEDTPVPLEQFDSFDPVIGGRISTTGRCSWKFINSCMVGFNSQHPRDIHDILAVIYHIAWQNMTLTGQDVVPLPEQAMIIPPEFSISTSD